MKCTWSALVLAAGCGAVQPAAVRPAAVRALPAPPAPEPATPPPKLIEEPMRQAEVDKFVTAANKKPPVKLGARAAKQVCQLPAGKLVVSGKQGAQRFVYCVGKRYAVRANCQAILAWGQQNQGGSSFFTVEFPAGRSPSLNMPIDADADTVQIYQDCSKP